jgi:hypothetical protein
MPSHSGQQSAVFRPDFQLLRYFCRLPISTAMTLGSPADETLPVRAALTRGKHEQIRDEASDTGHLRNVAGGSSDGHTGEGRDEQQQAYKEAASKENPRKP